MLEIRFHGRGGQGAVTASALLASAAFNDKKYSQAFGAFGPERRGAPVAAFTRIAEEFIRIRQQIYHPDIVVVLDPTLIKSVNVFEGMKKHGKVVINSAKDLQISNGFETHYVNATWIANQTIGKPIVNTAMLGALAKATGVVSLDALKKAVKEHFSPKLAERNLSALERTFEECEKC